MRVTESFSVIVCAYTAERWDELVLAVDSLQKQDTQPIEIIVVIDHNPALLTRACARFPTIQVIPNRHARGLSGARNSGVAVARGSIMAFMDEDACAAPDWLSELARGYDDPAVLGVGGAIIPAWPTQRPAWFPAEFDWVVGCTYRGMPAQQATVRNLIGCNMSFRREVFDAIGGFREGMGRIGTVPVGCEETELCIRVGQRWRESLLRYRPQAQVRHRVTPGRASWRYFFSRCYAEGISKAQVAQFVGANDGLNTERAYVWRTLPLAVLHGLASGLFRGDPGGLGRAAATVGGLAWTTFGYGRGWVRLLRKRTVRLAEAGQ